MDINKIKHRKGVSSGPIPHAYATVRAWERNKDGINRLKRALIELAHAVNYGTNDAQRMHLDAFWRIMEGFSDV